MNKIALYAAALGVDLGFKRSKFESWSLVELHTEVTLIKQKKSNLSASDRSHLMGVYANRHKNKFGTYPGENQE